MPSVVCTPSALPAPVPPPPPPLPLPLPPPPPVEKSVIEMSSMLIRLVPPSSLRTWNRIVPARLTVNVAVENEPGGGDRDVPTWVHDEPPFCDSNRPTRPL